MDLMISRNLVSLEISIEEGKTKIIKKEKAQLPPSSLSLSLLLPRVIFLVLVQGNGWSARSENLYSLVGICIVMWGLCD